MCEFYEVPFYTYGNKVELGHAIGKEFRASLAILDEGFAKGIRKYLEMETDITEQGGNRCQNYVYMKQRKNQKKTIKI